ncbi:MAG: ATP-binding protein [Acidimicrobiia bacterium]
MSDARLQMRFHGRIIDHLGIQMYQSPVAAVAELIANAWDADATQVEIQLPSGPINESAVITIADDGDGMTLEQCQQRFLEVGYNRRGTDVDQQSAGGRRVLGRKGIGKFAGFGIAGLIEIDTISRETGEHTVFELDLLRLRGEGKAYVETTPFEIPVVKHEAPDAARSKGHGTRLALKRLKLRRRPPAEQFRRSMARRFRLRERAEDFTVTVDGQALPEEDESTVEFRFPLNLSTEERSDGLTMDGEFGVELLGGGRQLRWRAVTYAEPIQDEELSGFVVYVKGKLAQSPFFFNLEGGLHAQAGQAYLSGIIEADFLDSLPTDVIATERQRIDWQNDVAAELLDWGQALVRKLLGAWNIRRTESKVRVLAEKLAPFDQRLDKFQPSERRTVERALTNIAGVRTMSQDQFTDVCNAVLVAWEEGRLKDLIDEIAKVDAIDEAGLLAVLVEANALTALHAAEAVRAKLLVIQGLRERIEQRDLENAVRDYIAGHPWLVNPRWETYARERRVDHLLEEAAQESGLAKEVDWEGRVDLVLAGGRELVVIEFMRPGLNADWDHIERFERYIRILRTKIRANTELGFDIVSGQLVADRLAHRPEIIDKLDAMGSDNMYAMDWKVLLENAAAQWQEFFHVLLQRAPGDDRLRALAQSDTIAGNSD